MKKTTIVAIMIIFSSIVLNTGCVEQNNTITMTMQERINDIVTNISGISGNVTTFKIEYNSLEDGGNIYIEDTIQNIVYDPLNDTTKVDFDDEVNSTFINYTYFLFQGDVTNTFSTGDGVKILLTVKLVTISFELGNFTINYIIELFEEQWAGEEFFKENVASGYPFKPMDESIIEKV